MVSTATDRRLGLNSGAALKVPCQAIAVTAINLAGEQTVNGIAVHAFGANGGPDRVLVAAGSVTNPGVASIDNGIWQVATGPWIRDIDFDGAWDVLSGTLVPVLGNPVTVYQLTTADPISVGSTALTFQQSVYTAAAQSFTPPGPGAVPTTTGLQLGQWLGTASNPITSPTTPVGNALATNSVLAINSTTSSATVREMAMQVGITATTGSARDSLGSGDKVALYTAVVGQTGGGNLWAFNPLVTIASGWTGCTGGTNQDAQVAEFDMNNNNVDYGPASGTAYGNPSATGLIITGAGTKYCTSAIQIVGTTPGNNPMWRFGIWFGFPGIQNATIVDQTNSITSYVANGSHTYGIDFNTGSYSGSPIRLGNAQSIVSRNSGGTADLALIGTAGNNMVVGGTGIGGIFCSNAVFPSVTNSQALGQASNAWSIVWAQQLTATSAAQNNGAGTISFGSGTASTIGAAGAASALPANPVGYMIINVAGSQMKIPYYNP